MYDVQSSKWYTQTATGNIPGPRRQFCAGVTWAEDQSSYNMWVEHIRLHQNKADYNTVTYMVGTVSATRSHTTMYISSRCRHTRGSKHSQPTTALRNCTHTEAVVRT